MFVYFAAYLSFFDRCGDFCYSDSHNEHMAAGFSAQDESMLQIPKFLSLNSEKISLPDFCIHCLVHFLQLTDNGIKIGPSDYVMYL